MKNKLPIFFAVLLFMACAEENTIQLDFTAKTITPADFSVCENPPCPKIEIDYLDFSEKGISKKIGQVMENRRAMIFKSSDEDNYTSLKEALDGFIAEFKRFNEEFPDFEADYEIRLKEDVVYRTDEILVVKTKYYIYKGGAHGYGATNFANFSLKTGKLLEAKDLFPQLDEFKAYAEEKFREKYNIPKGENINSTGFFFENDVFALPNNIAILEEEVVLVYNAYEAAAYANGEMVLRFPKSEVSVRY